MTTEHIEGLRNSDNISVHREQMLSEGDNHLERKLHQIRDILKSCPEGMTISGISRKIDLNRNTTARYLDMMLATGQVMMRPIGSAKFFYLSSRVPLTSLLDASSDMIVVLDENLVVVQVNDKFSNLLGLQKENVVGMNLRDTPFLMASDSRMMEHLNETLNGGYSTTEINFMNEGHLQYLAVTLLPAILEDGTAGASMIADDITDRKMAEDEIRHQHEFLENVIESLAHPFYIIDAEDFTIKMANNVACSEPLNDTSTCYAITHHAVKPCNGKDHPCPLEEVKKTKKSLTVEHVHYDINGDTKHVEVHAHPILDADGRVTDMIEYTIDISSRKEAEKTLIENESRYRSLFEDSSIALWEEDFSLVKDFLDELRAAGVVDFRAYFENHPEDVERCAELVRVLDVNRAAMELHGARDKNELLDTQPRSILDDELVVFREELISLVEGRAYFQNKDAQFTARRWKRAYIYNLTVPLGFEDSLSRVYLSVIDVTKLKLMEDALEETERQYLEIFTTAPDGIVIADLDETIVFANQAFADILGYELEELTGMNLLRHVPPHEAKKLLDEATVGKAGVPTVYDIEMIHKNGSKIIMKVSAVPRRSEGGIVTGIFCFIVDITRHIETVEQLQKKVKIERVVRGVAEHFLLSSDLEQATFHCLSDIANFLNAKRAIIFLLDADMKNGSFKHEWCVPGIPPVREKLKSQSISESSWWMKISEAREPIVVQKDSSIPGEVEVERELLQVMNVQSMLVVPLYLGQEVGGFLGVGFDRRDGFVQEEQNMLQSCVDIIGRALKKSLVREFSI